MQMKDWDKAVELRGRSFKRNLQTYRMLTEVKPQISVTNLQKPFNVAVVHMGAPCCGMNAAVRSFVRNINELGGTVFGVYEGIDGFVEGNLREIGWTEVNGWVQQGGANIGTRRTLPGDGERMAQIAKQLRAFKIQGLLAVGGFEAYHGVLQMTEAREKYEELRIPLVVVPATISNNVPGTDFSLGADTAVNEITEICDRIRQSAQGTKRRVFVIETMGGYCGYLATLAGLAGGADAAYIFEEQFTIRDLMGDVEHMQAKMHEGVQRGLILRNENCNPNYDTNFVTRLYSEEGKNIFTTRSNILGHMQQGGSPSPFDRNLGTKMASKAANWIFAQLNPDKKVFAYNYTDADTAVLLGLKGKGYETTSLMKLKDETDFK